MNKQGFKSQILEKLTNCHENLTSEGLWGELVQTAVR